jgi:hypothetical protein
MEPIVVLGEAHERQKRGSGTSLPIHSMDGPTKAGEAAPAEVINGEDIQETTTTANM